MLTHYRGSLFNNPFIHLRGSHFLRISCNVTDVIVVVPANYRCQFYFHCVDETRMGGFAYVLSFEEVFQWREVRYNVIVSS